ncbi:hypothetical protein BU15DRAFT_56305, partial [Melanogaster broomeanus]
KKRPLELWDAGWSPEEIAELFDVSEKSMQRWEDNLTRTGEVNPTSVLRGRPRLLQTSVMADLDALIHEVPTSSLTKSPTLPPRVRTPAPSSSLARPGVHPPASQWDEAARQAWWEDIAIKFNKDQFLFLDESGKDGRTLYRHFGRVRRGVRATKATPLQHGQ